MGIVVCRRPATPRLAWRTGRGASAGRYPMEVCDGCGGLALRAAGKRLVQIVPLR